MRRLVTIEQVTETPNEYGEPTQSWAEFAQVWAEQVDLTGRELLQAQQVRATITTRFTMRYLAGVTAKMRILSDGVTYILMSPMDPDGRKRTLVILAERYE